MVPNFDSFPELTDCKERISTWLSSQQISAEDKKSVLDLLANKETQELRDRFYKELEFGTGGLRGIIGAGTNRMNIYVVRRATQGLANYIKSRGEKAMSQGVAIAYDSRHFSLAFARSAGEVLAANGIRVFLFPTLQTTPALSFAIRKLGCISGICVTASHNPPQYNGFKVYWDDGAQIIPPHDKGILAEVFKITSWSEALLSDFDEKMKQGMIQYIGDEVLDDYYLAVKTLQLFPNAQKDLNIVYTPLHGTGSVPMRRALESWGYKNIFIVPEQEHPDGNFPTVRKPNPEEPAALKLAIELAEKTNADLVLATDPDSDRLALVVRDEKMAAGPLKNQAHGKYVLLNGNQTGALLIEHLLRGLKEKNLLKPAHKIVKTIVTSELHTRICQKYGVEIFDTLTGFKWIAGLVRSWEEQNKTDHEYLFGTEESFGFMPGPYVRDKDGIGAACMAVEMLSVLRSQGKTACQKLFEVFEEHGSWHEDLINVDLEGEQGAQRIARMMNEMRKNPQQTFSGVRVAKMYDFKEKKVLQQKENGAFETSKESINLPKSDVLQFELTDGSKISMRPSGTEPKLKFYLSVCTQKKDVLTDYSTTLQRIAGLQAEIKGFVDSVP
jgi:phosphoglucomutase